MTASRMVRQFGRCALFALAISLIVAKALAADDSQEAWAALVNGGHVALIRHGNAPPGYGGDPPGFKIDDCKTQRNLDEVGRQQAKALGESFRNHGVRVDRIRSSPWCRCVETAHLMAVGPVESSWALVPDMNPNATARLLENLQRTLADKVTAIGVLSWTRGDGASITREHATRYGVTFPLLHDGPIAAMNT